MARRRSRGEGSIFFWKQKGLWVSRLILPDGTPVVKYGKLQKDVREHHLNTLNQIRSGVLPKNEAITVADFMAYYMENVGKNILRPRTLEMYSSFIKVHINPSLGKLRLKDLQPHHLQSFYTKKLESGLSKRSVQLLHSTLRRALKQAVMWGMVPRNVCSLVQAPSPEKKAPAFYTREQLLTLLEAVKDDRFSLVYKLLIYGGFREGEVLGIHVEDCDLVNRVVNVRHAIITLKGGLVVGEPKTKTSRRAVTLPKAVFEDLEKHINQLKRNQGLIFTTRSGKPISPRNFIRHFKSTIEAAGLPELTVHGIRHSHASLLLASGVNPKVVQERLGHASISLTLDTYSHVIPSLQEEAAQKLDKIMGG
jgi:integrase